ncbi:oxytocin receptor-like isoform X4 [Varroa destructor]|uniref:G-protein coupled receptors family 1 profile domain-containing protein n=1 Tax=Varroa destructor TaxID=109461 RepID=A0A7M7M2Z9_VARDE|nr:oxytocin receptor-like isoform X4 [Varroa destructor]
MDSNSTGSITSSASPLTVIETTSREPPATDFRDEFIATVRVAVLGVALFLTMAGNIVVLVLVLQSKPKSAHLSRIYYFLLHLSIADILVGGQILSISAACEGGGNYRIDEINVFHDIRPAHKGYNMF